jgi:hypothetical protein
MSSCCNENLRAHPNTERVFAFCSDDATFTTTYRGIGSSLTVGKIIAKQIYKIFCENGVLELKNPETSFDVQDDCSFKTVQLRKNIFTNPH